MLEVVKPGFFSTIQDAGRAGYQQFGVIVSGAVDRVAYRLGNALLQQKNAAALEMTVIGGTFRFTKATVIALTGGLMQATLNKQPICMYKAVRVQAGDVLICGAISRGVRSYLCVRGGLTVPIVLGSRSTYLRAEIGGVYGRALRAGDCVPYDECRSFTQLVQVQHMPFYRTGPIRILHGTEWAQLDSHTQAAFLANNYTISLASDRMGYRLLPQQPILTKPFALLSEAVTFGTIQLPPNGEPIVLMADHQTIGGYPKIAQIIRADLHQLAQCAPQQVIQFETVTMAQAEFLDEQLERALLLIEQLLHASCPPPNQ